MIGNSSLLIESFSFLLPLATLVAVLGMALTSPRKPALYLALALTAAISILSGVRFANQLGSHQVLSDLQPEEVALIQVGERSLSHPRDVSLVVGALQESEWFSSQHGGWGTTVPLTITLASGQKYGFPVGYYLRQEGAVIVFRRYIGGYWDDGYAFSRRLPGVLKGLGILLPYQLP